MTNNMKVTTTARMVRSTQATRLVTGSLRSGAAARVNVQRNCSATASTFTRGKAVRQTEETKRKERKKEREEKNETATKGERGRRASQEEKIRETKKEKNECVRSLLCCFLFTASLCRSTLSEKSSPLFSTSVRFFFSFLHSLTHTLSLSLLSSISLRLWAFLC